jgi:hypothetical protein
VAYYLKSFCKLKCTPNGFSCYVLDLAIIQDSNSIILLSNFVTETHYFGPSMKKKTALNFRFLWLKNKAEINLFDNLHSFKVAEASDLISWLDFLLDNLFLCFGQGVYRQCIGIPMGTNCAVYLANFYLFTYEFDFIKRLLKSNTCPVVLHSLSLVCRFVYDLFVPNFPDFENFMYLNQDSFGSGIYP